jgi:hypothetical protein
MSEHDALEARVAGLELQVRHVLAPKLDAVSFGLSVMHEDLRAFREETGARLDRHAELLQETHTRLDRQDEVLQEIQARLAGQDDAMHEILRRLPGAADD